MSYECYIVVSCVVSCVVRIGVESCRVSAGLVCVVCLSLVCVVLRFGLVVRIGDPSRVSEYAG